MRRTGVRYVGDHLLRQADHAFTLSMELHRMMEKVGIFTTIHDSYELRPEDVPKFQKVINTWNEKYPQYKLFTDSQAKAEGRDMSSYKKQEYSLHKKPGQPETVVSKPLIPDLNREDWSYLKMRLERSIKLNNELLLMGPPKFIGNSVPPHILKHREEKTAAYEKRAEEARETIERCEALLKKFEGFV